MDGQLLTALFQKSMQSANVTERVKVTAAMLFSLKQKRHLNLCCVDSINCNIVFCAVLIV